MASARINGAEQGERFGDAGEFFRRQEQEPILGEERAAARLGHRLKHALVGGQFVREFGPRQSCEFGCRCIDHSENVPLVAVREQLVEFVLSLEPGDVLGEHFGSVGANSKMMNSIVNRKSGNEERQSNSEVSKSRAKIDNRGSCFQHLNRSDLGLALWQRTKGWAPRRPPELLRAIRA